MSYRIAKNTLVQLLGKLISTLSSIVVTFLIGRTLGPEFYGDFTKVFTTTTLLFMVLDFGLNATAVKHLTRRTGTPGSEFSFLFGLRLALAALLYLGLSLTMRFIPTPAASGYTALVKTSLAIFSLQYFAQATFLTANAVFQSRLRYDRSILASSLGSLVQLLLVVLSLLFSPSLLTISLAHLLGSLSMAVISLFLVAPLVGTITPQLSRQYILSRLTETAPISIALIFNLFATRIDTILLTLLRPTAEVGFYGLAHRVFDVALVFPTFFTNSTYPVLLEKIHRHLNISRPLFRAALVLLGSSLVASIGLFTLSPLLTLIRPDFAPAIPALRLLSLSLPLFFITSLCMWVVIAIGQQRRLIATYAVTFVFNAVVNFLTIPRFGYLAPAVTTGLTEALVLIFLIKPVLSTLKTYGSHS